TLKMPAFEWVHVQLHQQKGMISLSPPTICNSAGVKNKWNPDLNFLGMLPNRFNPRSEAQRETLKQLLSKYAHLLIAAKIGIRSSIPEALSEGKPVWHLKKTAAREAAKEFQEAFSIIFEKMGVAE
ncbi:ParA family protein, partial [Escherichia coli]